MEEQADAEDAPGFLAVGGTSEESGCREVVLRDSGLKAELLGRGSGYAGLLLG